ncbi:MAG: hypothetical protein PVF42_12180 [Desulfobacterales bacterium]|jgi:hypothetical protein
MTRPNAQNSKKMIDKSIDKKYPKCFGELETVFPKTKDGLRNTPEACLDCCHKTACLRSAMRGAGGVKVREEIVDRAYDSGMMSFLERWSKKKQLKRKLKKRFRGEHQRRE